MRRLAACFLALALAGCGAAHLATDQLAGISAQVDENARTAQAAAQNADQQLEAAQAANRALQAKVNQASNQVSDLQRQLDTRTQALDKALQEVRSLPRQVMQQVAGDDALTGAVEEKLAVWEAQMSSLDAAVASQKATAASVLEQSRAALDGLSARQGDLDDYLARAREPLTIISQYGPGAAGGGLLVMLALLFKWLAGLLSKKED